MFTALESIEVEQRRMIGKFIKFELESVCKEADFT